MEMGLYSAAVSSSTFNYGKNLFLEGESEMIKTTLNWTVKNLKSMYDGKNTLQMDHVIQRQSGQWEGDRLKKSLLIHSILANYPVPPIYCLKEPINEKDYSYSRGYQRLSTT